jgi:hypothetical protein
LDASTSQLNVGGEVQKVSSLRADNVRRMRGSALETTETLIPSARRPWTGC